MTRSNISRAVMAALLAAFALASAAPVAATEIETPAQASGRRIIVDLSDQRLYAYSGNALVFSTPVNARGTRTGSFRVQNKVRLASSIVRGWRLPNWLGIYYVGRIQNGIHGPAVTRSGSVTAASLGCVVLRSSAAALKLFRWATVGTPVTVRR
jgi:lipoprotein-anchoring transpeptidase ErfK/SrfK